MCHKCVYYRQSDQSIAIDRETNWRVHEQKLTTTSLSLSIQCSSSLRIRNWQEIDKSTDTHTSNRLYIGVSCSKKLQQTAVQMSKCHLHNTFLERESTYLNLLLFVLFYLRYWEKEGEEGNSHLSIDRCRTQAKQGLTELTEPWVSPTFREKDSFLLPVKRSSLSLLNHQISTWRFQLAANNVSIVRWSAAAAQAHINRGQMATAVMVTLSKKKKKSRRQPPPPPPATTTSSDISSSSRQKAHYSAAANYHDGQSKREKLNYCRQSKV